MFDHVGIGVTNLLESKAFFLKALQPLAFTAEKALGASLPASYRESMCRANGGVVEADDEDWELYPIANTLDRKPAVYAGSHETCELLKVADDFSELKTI